MEKDVLSFEKIRVNQDLIDEVWSLDPRNLEHIDGIKLSSYAMVLAQYLIYFTSQRNKSKAESVKLTRYIDRRVSLLLSQNKDFMKEYKTKAAATDYLITTQEDLMESQSRLEAIQQELMHIEGVDKQISELIATLKRELTRRENELYTVRQERRN